MQPEHKIRLSGIDAPEKRQPFGERWSSQHLGHLAHGRDATLQCRKTDRYRRKVCKVMVQPPDCPTCDKTLDVGLAQLNIGAAWWYREYAKEPSPEDRARYSVAEQDARAQKLGLWMDKNPVPPWEWRRLINRALKRDDAAFEAADEGGTRLPLTARCD